MRLSSFVASRSPKLISMSGQVVEDEGKNEPWLTRGVAGIGGASLLSDLGHEVPTSLLPSFVPEPRRSAHQLRLLESSRASPTAALTRRLDRGSGSRGEGDIASCARSAMTPCAEVHPHPQQTDFGARGIRLCSNRPSKGLGIKKRRYVRHDSLSPTAGRPVCSWFANATQFRWAYDLGVSGFGLIRRRGWDSNPRTSCPVNGFQDRAVRPLRHPAEPHCRVPRGRV